MAIIFITDKTQLSVIPTGERTFSINTKISLPVKKRGSNIERISGTENTYKKLQREAVEDSW